MEFIFDMLGRLGCICRLRYAAKERSLLETKEPLSRLYKNNIQTLIILPRK